MYTWAKPITTTTRPTATTAARPPALPISPAVIDEVCSPESLPAPAAKRREVTASAA